MGALILLLPSSVLAQEADRAFVGGSVLAWSGLKATEDPPGRGFRHFTYQGSLDWPALGGLVQGGVIFRSGWSFGGEFSLRQRRTTTVTFGSFGTMDSVGGTGVYTNDERLLSVVIRRHGRGRVVIEPGGGFTMVRTTRALTARRLVYSTSIGPISSTAPDVSLAESSSGFLGAVDLSVRADSGLTFVSGVRLYWLPGRQESEYDDNHIGLRSAGWVLQTGAGLIWRFSQR